MMYNSVMANSDDRPLHRQQREPRRTGWVTRAQRYLPYVYGVGLVALITLVELPLRSFIDPTNLVMLYLLAVVLAAVGLGRNPAILVSLLGVLAFDLVFVPPYNTFAVADAQFVLTFIALLGVGMLISTLTAQAREQTRAAQDRATHTRTLYELSRDLSMVLDPTDVAHTVVTHVNRVFRGKAAVLLPCGQSLEPALDSPGFVLDSLERDAAAWVHLRGQPAGRGTDILSGVKGTYLPLSSTQGVVGVLGFQSVLAVLNASEGSKVAVSPGQAGPLTSEQWRLLEAFASLTAQALTRIDLAHEARQAQLLRESEKLQAALLNSISHDLRTPLASIAGALSSLRDDAAYLDETARALLVNTAWEQADRLDDLVGNLLDITRLEAGVRKVQPELSDVQDLVGVALERLGSHLEERGLVLDVPDTLPPVPMDLPLMVQALVNLLDNALKYSPAGRSITVRAEEINLELHLTILDRGPGIPEEDSARIFDKFYRVHRSSEVTGTGLGLPISKGIVEAHGGRIWAANRAGGGAAFTIVLPTVRPPNQPIVEGME
jgi:two-component system, OmpR family, sensor histidine kinase KdpD